MSLTQVNPLIYSLKIDKENVRQEHHSQSSTIETPSHHDAVTKPSALHLSSTGRANSKFLSNRLHRPSFNINTSSPAPQGSKVLRTHFARLAIDTNEDEANQRLIASGALRVRTPTSQYVPTRSPSSAVRALDMNQPATFASSPSKSSPHRKGRKVIKCRRRKHRAGDNTSRSKDPLDSKEVVVFPPSVMNHSVDESMLTESSMMLSASIFRPVLAEVVPPSVTSEQSSEYSLSAEVSLGSPSSYKGRTVPSTPIHRRRHCVDPVAYTLWNNTANSSQPLEERETPSSSHFDDEASSIRTPSATPRMVSKNLRDVYGNQSSPQIFRPIPVMGRRAF